MADELKNLTDATKASIGEMPPGEVSQHAQAAMMKLHDEGQTDLAKELGDLLKAAQDNPVALKNAVIAFIEHHPQTLAAFSPRLANDIIEKM